MPSEWGSDADQTLRSLWGTFQRAASERWSTAEVWQGLRDAAFNSAQNVLGVTRGGFATESDIAQKADEMLSGISATDVSGYRQLASEWLRTRSELAALDATDQITGSAVFTPPWAETGGMAGVTPQYRARVQFTLTNRMYPSVELEPIWHTVNLGNTVTSTEDAIAAARADFAQRYGHRMGYRLGDALAQEIEVV